MIEKDRQDMSNPIGLCKLMLCSVFALLPYPHKAGHFQGFETIQARLEQQHVVLQALLIYKIL